MGLGCCVDCGVAWTGAWRGLGCGADWGVERKMGSGAEKGCGVEWNVIRWEGGKWMGGWWVGLMVGWMVGT